VLTSFKVGTYDDLRGFYGTWVPEVGTGAFFAFASTKQKRAQKRKEKKGDKSERAKRERKKG
jgi:hypothetical protein